ncbi:uncharacterized protein LOC117179011 isoform X2 [Belonocnema kinseyi]|uniref:uncharacterized protein LOC117179011 isoform X2 n=1 Tax=Belonocnema kinseyi TaxID=2817044 RepID=UPI00143DDA65|nr:uncharacterized protein LOC117179011 isoform X2 [Belonocnema kinseyi]
MPQPDLSRIHYKKCRYPSCNLTSRDGVPGLTFHAFPVRQSDRCIKWLVNCGLDDWVEMSEKELKLRYICSRHFSEDNFYATGRLKREAVPIILGLETHSMKQNKKGTKMRRIVSTEVDLLKKQIEKLEAKVEKERQKKLEIRAKLCATRVALSRLKTKLTEGTFQDIYLNKALANKLDGFVLTFIRMQLFHKQSTSYTTDEQRLCMMMHCISPALYSKMRDDFKFVLPNEITMVRWFNKLNISPKKANLSGSYNFEKIEQMLKEERESRIITFPIEGEHREDIKIDRLNQFLDIEESDDEEMEGFKEEEGLDGEKMEYSEEQMQRLTEQHLQALEDEEGQMEALEEHLQEYPEEHLEVLEDEVAQNLSLL